MLSEQLLERYRRNILLEGIGEEGQGKISAAKVLVVGTGGLGSPTAYYLAAAGIGQLGLVDDDVVSLSNLQRQILHSTKDLNRLKVVSAAEKIGALNPHITVKTYPLRLDETNAEDIISEYDLVIDGTDNFESRFILNRACVGSRKAFIHAAVLGFNGQITTLNYQGGPCYKCIFTDMPTPGSYPTAAEIGVLGAVPGVIGALQATEAVKIIAGVGEPLVGILLTYDALNANFFKIDIKRDGECPVCSNTSNKTG